MPPLLRKALFFAVLAGGAFGQQPSRQDPLAGLLSEAEPRTGEARLHITLLKVPAADAARAMLGDDGTSPAYWRETLITWRDASKMERLSDTPIEGVPGQRDIEGVPGQRELGAYAGYPFRFIGQDAASHFWDDQRQWEAWKDRPGARPPDGGQLLQELSEELIGRSFRADLGVKAWDPQADLSLSYGFTPEPEKNRPVLAWPLPVLSAPRHFFRPWSFATTAIIPVGPIFLLGCQMQPPHDEGQVQTGHVLMAFGRLTVSTHAQSASPKPAPQAVPIRRVQTWTLGVPLDAYDAWSRKPRNAQTDAHQLESWLEASHPGGPVELLATSALSASYGTRGSISSSLKWFDAGGFEPSGNPTVFTPLSCDGDQQHALSHELEFDLSPASRNFGEPPGAGQAFSMQINLSRPSAAARWVRCKTAFEGKDEDDPQAMEIAEADMERNESIHPRLLARPGQVCLAGAVLKEGRVHVSFARVVEETAKPAQQQPELAQAPASVLNSWMIETPLTWRDRLLSGPSPDLAAAAEELLDSLGKNEVQCVSLSALAADPGDRIAARCERPFTFFGGDYLNSAVHARGIYFNPRSVQQLMWGTRMEANLKGANTVSLDLHSADRPQKRHWGIWQPDLVNAGAASSGIALPTQAVGSVQTELSLRPNKAALAAVFQPGSLGAEKTVPAKLRWHVLRLDASPTRVDEHTLLDPNAGRSTPQTLQAVIIKRPSSAPAKDLPTSAAALLKAAHEGAVEVIDCVTVCRTHASYSAFISTGWDYHFSNGRLRAEGADRESEFHAPAVMPPGTEFSNQINLHNRLVGCQWRFDDETWTLTRDRRAPDIITDTFPNVVHEWPSDPDGPPWDQRPKTRVSVQRPIFDIQTVQGALPAKGEAHVTRLAEDTFLVIRVMD
jgi:hypothetical protein